MRMTVELLAYANRQKVAEALTERGYSVTRMTVNRWAKGGEMPAIAARMILALFGHDLGTAKAAPPEWAERLLAGVMALEAREAITDEELDRAAALAAAWAATGGQPGQPQQRGGGGGGAADA
jgi:hypothetical protein